MRTLLLTTILACATFAGCSKSSSTEASHTAAKVPSVTVDELDAMLANNECMAVDANGKRTRQKLGVIPGAVLLTDADTFLPSDLPADKAKPLVFYCANEACSASHEAAEQARTAGWKNVKVLPDGIAGWVKAGKKTQSI